MTALTRFADNEITSVENFGDSVIEGFVASRHGSEKTAKTYRNVCRVLISFFTARGITKPTTADIDAFINDLRGDKERGIPSKSPYTIRLYDTVTKLFFAYLAKQGKYPDIATDAAPLKLTKKKTHSKKALSDAQAKKLLNSVKESKLEDTAVTRRDRAIIALCLQAGLRTIEVARADVKDLKEDDGFWLLDVQGKGRVAKDETLKIALPVVNLILSYLELRGGYNKLKETDAPLFSSTSNHNSKFGCRFSEQSVGKMIKARMKAAGIDDKKITAHSTRHYAATAAIESGVDIRDVSSFLRHSSMVVTTTYLHDIDLKNRRAELAVADKLFSD